MSEDVGYRVQIDGVTPSSGRPLIPPGRHVLMINALPQRGTPVRMLFRATAQFLPAAEDGVELLISQPSATWRWTDLEPAREAWEQAGFDDSSWTAMTAGALTDAEAETYAARILLRAGAIPLTTPPGAGRLWIRTTFDVPQGGNRT
jgi:hypothetical protein